MEQLENTKTVDLVTPENREAFETYVESLLRKVGGTTIEADQYTAHSDALLVDVEVLSNIDRQ